MKKLFRPLVLGGVLLLAVGLAPVMDTTPARAATVTDANLKQMLEDLLREHPEIVLDVLRSHSEDVLDIAQAGANARRKAALEAQWHKEVKNTPQKQISLACRPVKGNAAAPVRIVAFSDFTCHYCQQATHVLDEIMKKYGKNVSLVYKHMPLDEQGPGMLAARYFVAVAAQSESKAWTPCMPTATACCWKARSSWTRSATSWAWTRLVCKRTPPVTRRPGSSPRIWMMPKS